MERNETLNVICERIKALEGEVCTLRVQNNRLRVVIAALVALAVLPYLLAAGMQTQTFSVLRVERLEFVEGGNLVAIMEGGAIPGIGSALSIYDSVGKQVVAIGSFTGGPFAGFQGLVLGPVEAGGGAGFVVTPDGNGVVVINNKYKKTVVQLGAFSKGGMARVGDGYLFVYDRDGNRILSASVNPITNAPILHIERLPHQGDTTMAAVAISVALNGSGIITTTNRSGFPIWISPLR